MLLRELQNRLAGLYDAPAEHDVYDFLITDAAHAAALQGAAAEPSTDEQLLVVEEEDGVGVTLYVDQSVIARLAERCPLQSLADENLADFCTALEGVSHFHYLVWCAGRERHVSLLELELQAEVDKYVSALQLMLQQRDGRFPAELFAAAVRPHRVPSAPAAARADALRGGAPIRGALLPQARGAVPQAPPRAAGGAARGVADLLPARPPRQAAPRGAVALRDANHSPSGFSVSFLRSSIHFDSSRRFFFFFQLCLPSAPLL